MRVLYLVSAYPRHEGDVITPWLVETIRRLRGRGVDVEVLAPAYRGSAGGDVDGVPVHRFRYAPASVETLTHDQTAPDRIRERPLYAALVPGYVAAGSAAAVRLARSGRFDVLHAFWPLPHGLLGLAAKRASGVPLVSTFFGVELTWMQSDLPFLRPVLRRIVRGSDAVTAISSYTAGKLTDAVPGTHAVRIPFGAAIEAPARVPPPFPSDDSPARLLFVGRLVARKGVDRLLSALAAVGDLDVRLRVVGDGPELRALERQAAELGIADRVQFTGFVPNEELRSAFEDSDIVVLPAVVDRKGDVEGLGVVLIEAMAYGRPVIGSRAGGIIDVISDGETGLLTPPGDVNALASAIRRLAQDRDSAREMGARGPDWVERQFSWEAVTGRLEQVYRGVRGGAATLVSPIEL